MILLNNRLKLFQQTTQQALGTAGPRTLNTSLDRHLPLSSDKNKHAETTLSLPHTPYRLPQTLLHLHVVLFLNLNIQGPTGELFKRINHSESS